MSVIINAGITTKLIIEIPAKGDTNWTSKVRQAFQDIGDHDHTGVNGKGTQITSAAIKDAAILPQHLSNDIELPALNDVQLTYDPSNASNPTLDGKLLAWSSTAAKWVAIDPSATVSGVISLNNVNTVHAFQNAVNIGATLNVNTASAFTSSGGVADFTYAIGGVASSSPSLSDLVIFSSVPLKIQNATRLKIMTDSPLTITGTCEDCYIQSSSTVSITGISKRNNITSGNLTLSAIMLNSRLQVSGNLTSTVSIDNCMVNVSSDITAVDLQDSSIYAYNVASCVNIYDCSIVTNLSLNASGTIHDSTIKAGADCVAKRFSNSTIHTDNLKLDYSSYTTSSTISYDIQGSSIFANNTITIINDSTNFNTAEFRGGIYDSNLQAPNATLLNNGTSTLDDSVIDVAKIQHSAGGGNEYNDCMVTARQFEVADSAIGLDPGTTLDIAQWNNTTLGFNNVSYGGNIQNKPVKIVDGKIQNCTARLFAGASDKDYATNGGGTTGNLGGGATRNLLSLNNYHNNLTYNTDSTHINLAPYWSDSDNGIKIRKAGWYEVLTKVYVQVDAVDADEDSVYNSANLFYKKESGHNSGRTYAVGQEHNNHGSGAPHSSEMFSSNGTFINRADPGNMRKTYVGDPVKFYFDKNDVISLNCTFSPGGNTNNDTRYAVFFWEIAMLHGTDNNDF